MTDHGHPHDHDEPTPADQRAADLSIPDEDLSPRELSRRDFLRGLGVLGVAAGAAGLGILPSSLVSPRTARASSDAARAAVETPSAAHIDPDSLRWLAGDHHIHTQFSSDAQYRVADQVGHALENDLDWLVITDHGRVAHEKVGIDRTSTDNLAARAAHRDALVFQGLEWNIPGAEHGTVFLAPGAYEKDILHAFEASYDGVVVYGSGATANDAVHEAKAIEAINFLSAQVAAGRSSAALFLANHPARRGLDSPHEIRAWNDADPSIAVGFEGAPGHQAAGIAVADGGPGSARGFYDFSPLADSHPGYPLEAYRTHGGFDWMTARVGGLWDSLLAEGRRWWITANSDSHAVYHDTMVRGAGNGQFDNPASPNFGAYGDPVDTGVPVNGNGDFWPGYYSRTVVGATHRGYRSVMAAIAAGRMWVCHGELIRSLDARVTVPGAFRGMETTLGGTAVVRHGDEVHVRIEIGLPRRPNHAGVVPRLRRVDLIAGPVTGAASDRDTLGAPATQVVQSFDIGRSDGRIVLDYRFRNVRESFYLRIRGTDGNVSAPGSIEPRLDPVPMDPWTDLWFYSNPIFVRVGR